LKIKENHSKWWANLPPNEFLRVGNWSIGRNFTMGKKKKKELRRACDPLQPSLPLPVDKGVQPVAVTIISL